MTHILIVDDDRIVRHSLSDVLQHAGGYEVSAAKDGFECLEMAQANPPDLIICDVEMPRLDGYGVVEALQQNAETAAIPFIFLTGRSDQHSMRQGMTLGADDYIPKPFVVDELLKAVSTRLAKRNLIEEHYENKLEALRDNILLAVPHELRSPLALIIGYGDVLSRETTKLSLEQIASLAQTITSSGKRLHHLIENYIVYAQIELLMTEPERIKTMRTVREAIPDQIIQDVIQANEEKYGRFAQLDLQATDLILPISKSNFEKIMEELVENAFKFSLPETAVTLSTHITNSLFTAVISNKGQGMTAEQIDNIGAYMQFERKIHEQQGSGMGLIIAKRLVNIYGGQLTIQSELGATTHVTVHLPI